MQEVAENTREQWLRWSALLSVLFAVMAAQAGLESAHYANNAMIEQIQASDQWSYYQAKGIKAMLVETEHKLQKKSSPDDVAKLQKYHTEQQKIKEEGDRLSEKSKANLERHEVLARAVTMFQIGIAIIGIAVLTKRRYFVLASAGMGAIGVFFLCQGFLML